MEQLEFIYKRKSIRQFKKEAVPREVIEACLKAATFAPSPKHQQNWHFVVIENKEMIHKLGEIVERNHTRLAHLARTEEEQRQYMRFLKYYTCFTGAPTVILVYAKPYEMVEEEILRESQVDASIIEELLAPQSGAQGIGAAVENFLLAAANMGYGTCYMTGPTHSKREIEECVGFSKENYGLMAMIACGVPVDQTPPQPPRKPLEKVVTFID
ncbi:nitroreductase [Sporanaerobium hydrogeniformans]|uniref:Nitroreductase n=1 Tax=Sporanaerobium hydrogeniformans TaxID=3072179 RepID=A0AC61DG57_9FIRM|nr:nitroreductase family protein [Sporanaerobium hydrogeniformans]PHV72244.1 nitroreductase [Sporanaerobium hydrogeniformans]